MTVTLFQSLLRRAGREPLDVDISDYSDEFCEGFLRGQEHALVRMEQEIERYEIARQEDESRIAELLARIDRQTSHIAQLREGCYDEGVRAKRAERALGEIEGKARWYADKDQRDPQEVDHALCVEILDLAQRALDAD
jgi:hypothetical protein